MTEQGQEEYDYDALFRIVNYGIFFDSAEEAQYVLKLHVDMMDKEKQAGNPKGDAVWYGYMSILRQIIKRRDELRAKEKDMEDGTIWVPYSIR